MRCWARGVTLVVLASFGACFSGGDYASEPEISGSKLDASSDGQGGNAWPSGGNAGSAGNAGNAGQGAGGIPVGGCPSGACEPGETCATCPQDCGACCGNAACEADKGENCASCPQDCGGCCPNGACDNAETCGTCPQDCGGCCGNTLCDNGENCDSCPGDCGCVQCYARCCSGNALYGPKMVANGEACKDWGTWASQCGSINNLVRVSINGGLYWEQPNRCWALCGNYSVYHLLSGVTSNCAAAVQTECQSHGGFVDAAWQYCDPT